MLTVLIGLGLVEWVGQSVTGIIRQKNPMVSEHGIVKLSLISAIRGMGITYYYFLTKQNI